MLHQRIKMISLLLWISIFGGYAQQTCYQTGINEGRLIYNEAQRLERSGRCVDAVPKFWEALGRFRLVRSCRDLPANHELDTWENRCIQGITSCGGKSDASTYLIVSPRTVAFTEKGDAQAIIVTTNTNTWRVEKSPSWCVVQKSSTRVTVTCQENLENNGRSEKLVIVANTLTMEVTIEQEGKKTTKTPDYEQIKITEVKFAGKNADGAFQPFGDTLYDPVSFLQPRITFDYLTIDTSTILLDFKIIDPNGNLLSGKDSGYTFSTEISLRGNLYQKDVIELPEWGFADEQVSEMKGAYTSEIWCAGTQMYASSFIVLPQSIPPDDNITYKEDTTRVETAKQDLVSPDSLFAGVYDTPIHSPLSLSFGLKAGLNLSNISNNLSDISFSPRMKPDFHIGALCNLNFGSRNDQPGFFGLQIEVLYSRQGFTVDGEKVNFNYITIPLLAKLYVYEGFNLELGPWMSYLLAVAPNEMAIDGNTIRLSDLKGGKDVGLAVGAAYESALGWIVNARYMHGLSDMARNIQWKNQVISISVGWKF